MAPFPLRGHHGPLSPKGRPWSQPLGWGNTLLKPQESVCNGLCLMPPAKPGPYGGPVPDRVKVTPASKDNQLGLQTPVQTLFSEHLLSTWYV